MKMILVTLFLFAKFCTSDEGNHLETVIEQDKDPSELKNDRIPHLFIFKRSANESSNSEKKNAGFVLVDTAIRGSDKKLKYSPVVDGKSISTTPSSAQGRRNERSAAHFTPGPNIHSSTIS